MVEVDWLPVVEMTTTHFGKAKVGDIIYGWFDFGDGKREYKFIVNRVNDVHNTNIKDMREFQLIAIEELTNDNDN